MGIADKKTYNYCTLFDSHYLIRGLALYKSMLATGDDFHLYILAFDDICERILKKLSFAKATVIGMDEFESPILKEIKKERTIAEYCWTCTSFAIEFVMNKYMLEEVTYIDADLYFFNKPSILIEEFRNSDKDVLLMEHRYALECSFKEEMYGKYNVEFMTFRNSERGRAILSWWKESCREWCYARLEEGRFGDQKYLEYFEDKFSGTHVCANIGGGVAPWNINQYEMSYVEKSKSPYINTEPIVFYHFHELKWYGEDDFDPGNGYGAFSEYVIEYIYGPYIRALAVCAGMVKESWPDFKYLNDFRVEDNGDVLENELFRKKDVISVINHFNIAQKPIYIWGAGKNGKKMLSFLDKYGISYAGVVDSNFLRLSTDDFCVKDTKCLMDNSCFVIVSPLNYRDSIINQLTSWGYKKGDGFITCDMLVRELEKIQ